MYKLYRKRENHPDPEVLNGAMKDFIETESFSSLASIYGAAEEFASVTDFHPNEVFAVVWTGTSGPTPTTTIYRGFRLFKNRQDIHTEVEELKV